MNITIMETIHHLSTVETIMMKIIIGLAGSADPT